MATKKTRCERYCSNVFESKTLWKMSFRADSWNFYKTMKWSIEKAWERCDRNKTTEHIQNSERKVKWQVIESDIVKFFSVTTWCACSVWSDEINANFFIFFVMTFYYSLIMFRLFLSFNILIFLLLFITVYNTN